MPYIGKSPVGGGFHKPDNLTASATATYALTLGGAAYYPETANQLLCSLNGIIQAPQDSFTVSGSNLVFDSALTASDSINFVVALGDVLGVQGVTDGTVTTAKIANQAVTMDKLATSGTLPALDGSALTGLGGSNIKEQLAILADGQNYVYGGTTYTADNVTAVQALTESHAKIDGSQISYLPPAGTVAVHYQFNFQFSYVQPTVYTHFKLTIDSDDVTDSRTTIAVQSYLQDLITFDWIIPIGGSANTATGRQANWTSAKVLKVQGRNYTNASHGGKVHETTHWDGNPTAVLRRPTLTITALG